jgi:hypothetical protein
MRETSGTAGPPFSLHWASSAGPGYGTALSGRSLPLWQGSVPEAIGEEEPGLMMAQLL